jgi:hypothetical protein
MEFERLNAIIALFPTKVGGRQSYLIEEYTPNAVFGFDLEGLARLWDHTCYKYSEVDTDTIKNSGVRVLIGPNKIYPGSAFKAELLVTKMGARYLGKQLMASGSTFLLREGARVVGTGVIE